jgi:hypothetical protein
MHKCFTTLRYRLRQARQQLGGGRPLAAEEYAEVALWLPPAALALFATMSAADQQHSLRVCRGLRQRGCVEGDMLAAALLHDVGKAEGRVPFWTRPAIVLGQRLAPGLLRRLVAYPATGDDRTAGARRALSFAWYHAEVGAQLAAGCGLSERTLLYILTHHQPHGPAAELHAVDEVS